jgi:MTH538 TIR-like domain (DUF1863)
MGHKVYISFKTEDMSYKDEVQSWVHLEYVDKSLNYPIDSDNPDYILRKIREDYLSDSTVTVHLIGKHSGEWRGELEQYFIKKELQASLYNGGSNTKNGILGVVLPSMVSTIFGGSSTCSTCGTTHRLVRVEENTVKEFSYNYFIPNDKCSWAEEDRYCVLVGWDDFRGKPNDWIGEAFDKRSALIASKTMVRP